MSGSASGTSRARLTGLVARREYLRTVRRRGYVFGTLLLPIGIAVLMGISMFFSTSGFDDDGQARGTIVVVNESDVAITEFRTELASLDTSTEADARARLDAGDVRRAREKFALSYGSCSFTEPVEDLVRLRLLPD